MSKEIHVIEVREGIIDGDWMWCLHCERVYLSGEYLEDETLQMCPYEYCDGSSVLDAWKWERLREFHPSYPEIPTRGKLYPLYGKGDYE
ncbi:MAG: hypothetical protein WBB69_08495 [Anaerolineales bacterium]